MTHQELNNNAYFWALQGLCALHRKPFSLELAQQQLAAPYTNHSLVAALEHYGLTVSTHKRKSVQLHKESFPSWSG